MLPLAEKHEKDLEAEDYYVEDYSTDPKTTDDPYLAVDIDVVLE